MYFTNIFISSNRFLLLFLFFSDHIAERGMYGFFQGIFPPLIGSVLYRMTMLSAYESSYTYLNMKPKNSLWQLEICDGYVPRPLVFASALFASITRSVVESPFEYMKVMRQTDSKWLLKDIYQGFTIQTIRTTSMLMWIFVPYDVIKTKTNLMSTYKGQFVCTTLICCWCYAISWPFETLKNMTQGGIPHVKASFADRVRYLGGWKGLYRGASIGIIGGGFRNGVAMVAMNNWQRLASTFGLRKEIERR